MEQIFTLLFLSLLATPLACDKGAFAYLITSSSSCGVDPVYGIGLERTVTAVDVALSHVNSLLDLLPAINLTYGNTVNTLECPVTGNSLEEVLHPHNYGILGYSCGMPAQQDFFMGPLSNFTPMITYAPTSFAGLLSLSSSSIEQPVLFSIHPTSNTHASAILGLLREFDWKRLSIITEGAGFFEEVLQDIRKLAPVFTVKVFESKRLLATGNFLIPEYLRIIFMNMNMSSASQVLCQASNVGYVFPDYIWITYGGDFVSSASSLSCNSSQLARIVDGMFTIEPVVRDNGQIIDGLITDMIQNISDIEDTIPLSYYAVDAVLVLAQAINATLTGWSSNSPDWSFCEKERDTKMTSISRCFVRQKLLNISLQGLTGAISFTASGEREQHEIGLFQYRNEGPSSNVRIGRIDVTTSTNRVTFEFVDSENETTLFRGPVPADSSPIKVIRVPPLALIIVYYILASAGIIFCFVCFLFNIVFRKRKIVKLISPNLNYFIVLGAFLLYSSIYFRSYPDTTLLNAYIRCNTQGFLLCLGYVLCFAPVLMKMWRVFYIFHNPSQKKKVLKDWHLTLGTNLLVGIILAILIIGLLVPVLRPDPTLIDDIELRGGVNEDGIETLNCIYQCYELFTPSLAWVAVQFIYLILLQVAAFVLAIITRKVKIKVLNDSKQMAIIVYTSTTVMLVLGVITFALPSRLIVNEVLFVLGQMLATTVFLGLVFVPKMLDLYKDPRGEGIFGRNTTVDIIRNSPLPTTTFTKSYTMSKSFTDRKSFAKNKTCTM